MKSAMTGSWSRKVADFIAEQTGINTSDRIICGHVNGAVGEGEMLSALPTRELGLRTSAACLMKPVLALGQRCCWMLKATISGGSSAGGENFGEEDVIGHPVAGAGR